MRKLTFGCAAVLLLTQSGCSEDAPEPAETETATLESYTATGNEPGWKVELADEQISFTSQSGENDFSLPVQRMNKTDSGWEVKAFSDQHNITLTIASDTACDDSMSDQQFADTVELAVSEEGYLKGCGGDLLSGEETP